MQRFDVTQVGKRARGTLASPGRLAMDVRPGVLAFGAGLLVGVVIGGYLGLGPFRALASTASERARDVGGDLIDRARNGVDRATNGQAFVALSTEPEPALAGHARAPGHNRRARPV